MNSEQLGALVADLLGTPGPVPVRRGGPSQPYDLVCGGVRASDPGVSAAVVAAVSAHPDVAHAVLGSGLLQVWLTDDAVARGLVLPHRPASERLRVPDRPFLLGKAERPVEAGEARRLLGGDVVAYHLARAHRRGAHGPIRLDVEAAVGRTPRSPLFLVQHAHARAAMLGDRAAALGLGPIRDNRVRDNDVPLLRRGPSAALVASMLELPATVARAVRRDEVRLLPAHLEEVAGLLDAVEPERRFLPSGEDEAADEHRVGLRLTRTLREMLAGALRLLDVSAPARI